MNIHEYQAKELFRQYGIPTPTGYPAFTVDEAVAAAQKLPGPVWVVKAQIHAGGRGKGGKSALKITNIVEQMDVGLPRRLVYDQWTQFEQFPSFMKKVEGADQETDEKVNWKAQILWSHRNWESTIIEQVPDDHFGIDSS